MRVRAWLGNAGWLAGVALGCAEIGPRAADSVGAPLWHTTLDVGGGDTGWHGMPAVDGRHVYVATGTGFAALDVSTGNVAWHADLWARRGPTAGTLLVRGGRLLVHDEHAAAALDAASGRPLWGWQADSLNSIAPVGADDAALYAATRDRQVIALDITSGQPVWRTTLDRDPREAAGGRWPYGGWTVGTAVSGDTVYANVVRYLSENKFLVAGVVVALDRRTGRELWRFQTDTTQRHDVSGAPAVADRLLVVSDAEGHAFFALDRFTGREVWRTATRANYAGPTATPVVNASMVLVGSNDLAVYAADVATGHVLWTGTTPASVEDVGVCPRWVLANNQGVTFLNRSSGRPAATVLQRSDEFTTGGIATTSDRAFVTTAAGVYAFGC